MTPVHPLDIAILQAVTYAALFDFPLTLPELREAIGVPATEEAVRERLDRSPWLAAVVTERAGFVYPSGRDELPGVRRRREALTLPRLRADVPVLRFLVDLPFVHLVALSGSVAHLNTDDGEAEGDLDLFVVTAPGRAWLVMVVALVVARLRGWRRRLCLNYVTTEAALAVRPADCYAASQIVSLRPLAGEAAYRRFLAANPFVSTYYPNFVPRPLESLPVGPSAGPSAGALLLRMLAPLLERLSRLVYGWHLRRRSAAWTTREDVRIEAECLKLHTASHRDAVRRRFEAALDSARAVADATVARTAPPADSPSLLRSRRPA